MIFPDDIFYVAAPYSDADPAVVSSRMETFHNMDAIFIAHQMVTVSPLAKHPAVIRSKLPGNWEFWKDYSEKLLFRCTHMLVLSIEGWLTSEGVMAEIEYCEENMIPYTILSERDIRTGKFCAMIQWTKDD